MQRSLHGKGKRLDAENRTGADGFMFDFFFLNHPLPPRLLLTEWWRIGGLDLKYHNKMCGNLCN